MAFRASETFYVGDKDKRRRQFIKDAPVPADVAKKLPHLVYDDGSKAAAVKAAPAV